MADNDRTGLAWAYTVGFNFAAAVAGFVLIGWAVDAYYDTGPWGLLIGACLGIVGGMYNMIREALKLSQQSGGSGRKTPDEGPRD